MSTITLHPPLRTSVSSGAGSRLTRRGRLVVFALGLLLVLALGLVLAGGSMATSEKEATETFVVGPGDTLWDLASDLTDGGDVRAMMRHIQDLNSLDSVALVLRPAPAGAGRVETTTLRRPASTPGRRIRGTRGRSRWEDGFALALISWAVGSVGPSRATKEDTTPVRSALA